MTLPSLVPAVIEFHDHESPTGNASILPQASPLASNRETASLDPSLPLPVALSNHVVNSTRPSRCRYSTVPIPPSHGYRKTGYRIQMAALNLVDMAGCDRVVFTTITFRRAPANLETAVEKFQKIVSALKKRYPALLYLWVASRFISGGFHVHALFAFGQDVVTGTDMSLCSIKNPSPADLRAALNPAGQRFWADLAKAGRPHGLGRISMFPICSNAEAIGVYLSRNFWEFQRSRRLSDFRRRAWGMSRAIPRPPDASAFSLNRPGNVRHRQRLAEAALRLHGIRDLDAAKRILGPRWHWWLCREIYGPVTDHAAPVPQQEVRAA